MASTIRTFALSDVGLVRTNNEDEFLIHRHRGMTFLAVADGMGGAAGGEVASRLAVETIRELVRKSEKSEPVQDLIFECILSAHQRIRRRGKTNFGQINMGTTLTMIVIRKNLESSDTFDVFLGHVGDSRFYLMERGGMRQVSRDHSMKQYMLDMGILKSHDKMASRYKNVIYRSLGGSADVEIDPVKQLVVPGGSVALLCTDGLSNYVSDKEMAKIVGDGGHLKHSARELVELAKSRGGGDNVTVVLAACGHGEERKGIWSRIVQALRSFPL